MWWSNITIQVYYSYVFYQWAILLYLEAQPKQDFLQNDSCSLPLYRRFFSKPENAVDGLYDDGSIRRFKSNYGSNPALIVDLGSRKNIKIINILPRTDAVSTLFKKAEVCVLNSMKLSMNKLFITGFFILSFTVYFVLTWLPIFIEDSSW